MTKYIMTSEVDMNNRTNKFFLTMIFAALMALSFVVTYTPVYASNIHFRLAVQHKNERRFEEAIEEFRRVLAVYPDHHETYMHLAEIRRAQGNHQLVIYNLQRALTFNPGWGRAQLMLADAFAADGQLDRAIREYQVYQSGSDPAVRDSIQGIINGLMGRIRGGPAPAATGAQPVRTDQPSAQQPATPARTVQPTTQPTAAASAATNPPAVRMDQRTESIMARVRALYAEDNRDGTIAAVREVLAIQSNHPGAFYYAGLVRQKNNQLDMAKINFRRALPHPTYNGAANFHLGVILGAEGNRAEAVRHLRAALASNSQDFDRAEAARLIELYGRPAAQTARTGQQSQQAQPSQQTQADPSSSQQPTTAAAAADTAALREVAPERYAPIEIRIDDMLSMMTVDTLTDIGQKLLAGIRAFEEARYDDALREFRRVLAENPSGPIAAHCIYNAGISLFRLRLFRDSENQFQQFLDRFPNHRFAPRAQFFRACTFQERGDYAVSERLFRQFIQNNRNHEWTGRAYERLGDSFTDMGDHRRAMDAYNQALQNRHTTPADRVIINYKLGIAATQMGDLNRAVNFFNAAIEAGERNEVFARVPDSYYKIADIRFQQRNFQAALDFYTRATRKYPTFHETPWGLFQIAGAHRNLQQYREAVNMYRELMQRFPEDYWSQQAQWRLEDTIWEHEFRAGR